MVAPHNRAWVLAAYGCGCTRSSQSSAGTTPSSGTSDIGIASGAEATCSPTRTTTSGARGTTGQLGASNRGRGRRNRFEPQPDVPAPDLDKQSQARIVIPGSNRGLLHDASSLSKCNQKPASQDREQRTGQQRPEVGSSRRDFRVPASDLVDRSDRGL